MGVPRSRTLALSIASLFGHEVVCSRAELNANRTLDSTIDGMR